MVFVVILGAAVDVTVKVNKAVHHPLPADKWVMTKNIRMLVVRKFQVIMSLLKNARSVFLVVVSSYKDLVAADPS